MHDSDNDEVALALVNRVILNSKTLRIKLRPQSSPSTRNRRRYNRTERPTDSLIQNSWRYSTIRLVFRIRTLAKPGGMPPILLQTRLQCMPAKQPDAC
mmetsp:Transcript_28642/g.59996  ORF Transcript_28642/g.59996 Transcript_28642/m.59996 type:complete len:98 (+) Transcript_28642:282-575(+)